MRWWYKLTEGVVVQELFVIQMMMLLVIVVCASFQVSSANSLSGKIKQLTIKVESLEIKIEKKPDADPLAEFIGIDEIMQSLPEDLVSDTPQEDDDERSGRIPATKFKVNDCIFGGSGSEKKGHEADEGYRIIGIDLEAKQYLLECKTKDNCRTGLRTYWIESFDEYMMKVECFRLD